MPRKNIVIRGAGVLVVAGVLAGGGSYVVGGGDEVANAWVNTTAQTCTRSATPISFETAQSNGWLCTWDGANDACQGGDNVRVKGGSYGNVSLTGSNSRSSACRITVAASENVTINAFEWDLGVATAWITLVGPLTTRELYVDLTSNSVVDNVTVDGQFQTGAAQILHIEGTTGPFTFKNSVVKNSCATTGNGAMVWVDAAGTNAVTLDNNEFHDAHNCDPGGDPHTECMYLQNPDNVTLTRNKFYKCATMDVFVTGQDTSNGLYVENNVFGRPCNDNVNPHVCSTPGGNAFHYRSGTTPAPVMIDSTFRYNTFRGNLSISNGASGTNVLKGNIFIAGTDCPAGITYSYNAHVSGSCGGTGSFNDATLGSDFVNGDDYASGGGDWTPISGGGMVDVGDTGSYPTLDLLGATRYDGSAPDIGAVERQT